MIERREEGAAKRIIRYPVGNPTPDGRKGVGKGNLKLLGSVDTAYPSS